MKEFDYKPKSELVTGTVTLKVPSYKERIAMLKEMNISFNAEGGIDLTKGMDLMERLSSKLEDHVSKVDLKSGEVKFKSLEDLSYYAEGQEIINELGQVLMMGLSLGKK